MVMVVLVLMVNNWLVMGLLRRNWYVSCVENRGDHGGGVAGSVSVFSVLALGGAANLCWYGVKG